MKYYLPLIALVTLTPTLLIPEPIIAEETQLVAQEIEPEIEEYARSISVKIAVDGKNKGSGVLIGKQDGKYPIVTNHHVVRGGSEFTIQTADGTNHQASIVPNPISSDDDIALLSFNSNNEYQPVRLNSVNTAREEKTIYAVGYAAETGEFTIAGGNIGRVNQKPFQEGYQIGYSSDVLEGMSGGAIFDNAGDLVGINGIGAFPILDTAYQYEDETTPSAPEIEQFRTLSWGLSLHRLLTQLNPEIITAYGLPQPETAADLGKTALTGWLGDLETKAKEITVRIDNLSGGNGSGVIIAKEGNTYTVLTADHVLCDRDEETNECLDRDYEIITPDGQKYSLDPQTINSQPGVDLAVFKFTSSETYQVAELADYPLTNNDAVFVAGYPQLAANTDPQWHFSLGYGFDKEQGLLNVNVTSNSNSQENSESLSQSSLAEGYEMVYTSPTYGGMSGGAVLDRVGRVIGIHGQAEGETVLNNQSGTENTIQLGYSLGIPINTLIGLKARLGVEETLTVAENSPAELNPGERETFESAILGTEISQSNANAKRWLERGNQLWRLRRYEDAEAAFNRVLELDEPELHYLAHYGKGLTLKDRGKLELALASLESATTSNSEFAPAFEEKSLVLQWLDRFDEALVAIDKAIDLELSNPNYYLTKAGLHRNLKQYDEAEIAYNKAIEISPRAAFFHNRGVLYAEQGEGELALADYNQALKINPNLASTYNNRGILYAEQGEGELALADYNQAIKINPNLALAYYNRGILYKEQFLNF
ncbi:MAG: tetratricopeptide repeat-containing serine protease family protein [Pleurocapsa sp. MO_226.B13]|nr:tetratricopeptide repeat-containing serine protease family protein [Pleurocapsa sp. MO_226.B13]